MDSKKSRSDVWTIAGIFSSLTLDIFDHLFPLIFATAAALVLAGEWQMDYAELIPYATPGLVAFGVFSLPAGWLADRWSREGMMAVFFVGRNLGFCQRILCEGPA